ncbi:TetR family transcriptional regulator [Aldersonia sp. NBC_00410]|uniref:TetR/AcrR family transcriptional regulator n=1 Tax=Aldersonia sp. NBC_00410 TaxID=2975954 RepID=UPI002258D42C|nr:TetR/AcrR family transcriptional regulator [Aldersonia sp. NBC_00410]MCX5042714.1 TetR family transcriptional regulator [Aldersonia sp. NBC_00410]
MVGDELSVRDRILAATLLIVGTDGVAAVSNRRIAATAGVSLGSITYHFPTQNALLRDALLGFVRDETARLTELAESYRTEDLSVSDAAAIVERVAKDLAFSAERIAPFELYIQAGRDEELRPAAADCFAAYDLLTVRILESLGISDAVALAPTIVATVTGLQLRRLATGSAEAHISATILRLLHSSPLGSVAPN